MKKLDQSKAAQLERARRSKQMAVVGRIAANSPFHVSNINKRIAARKAGPGGR